jgi:D-alanyl-D-alanine carboxypeptidase
MKTWAGWILVVGLMLGLVACGSDASPVSTSSTTTTPNTSSTSGPTTSSTTVPTTVPTTQTSTVPIEPFPTAAFAALSDDPVAEEVAAKFQAALDGMAPEGGIAATGITPEGTWSGAAGTADGVHDLEIDSQFGIASGTKPIIAAQVMLLVEAGEVLLDAPATDYLPADFTFDTNGATIRQLLSHRSGIPDWYDAERFAVDRSRVWELDEILALVPAARRPVGSFEYADTNYNLLGLVIEHVRQRPLTDVLRDVVLRVEGTERLIYQPDEAPTDPMAMPRGESRDALELGGGYLPSISDTIDGAAGAMASDSISLARWWRAFCAGDIVSEASLTEMAAFYDNVASELPVDYGLGLFNPAELASVKAVGHLGANFGYKSSAGCLTEDPLIFVVLTNQDLNSFALATPLLMAARSE